MDRTNKAAILAYHSVNVSSEDRIRIPNLVSPHNFEDQLRYFASSANVISLPDYLDCVTRGRALPRHAVVITFDDGYKDNLTQAVPLLRRYNLPATFFLATDYIGTGKMKWEDQLSCLLRRTQVTTLSLDIPPASETFSLDGEPGRFKVINQLVSKFARLDSLKRQQLLEQLQQALGVPCGDSGDLMLTWDDVREMANTPGITIGAHTASHCHLSQISDADISREIVSAKAQIEANIPHKVTAFSYPYGDLNDTAVDVLRANGFDCAATIAYGKNGPDTDLYRLKRVLVPDQGGLKLRVGLWLRCSIIGESLKRGYNILNKMK